MVLAMVRFIGIEDARKSAFASALLIAIAWGTSVGGSGRRWEGRTTCWQCSSSNDNS